MPLLNLIASSSKGNFNIYDEFIGVDCGVPFKIVQQHFGKLRLLIITHKHIDHLNIETLVSICKRRPDITIYAPKDVVNEMHLKGFKINEINLKNELNIEIIKGYNLTIKFVNLYHDVQNIGILFKRVDKILGGTTYQFYATDTHTLSGIKIPKCNEIYLECNYEDEKLQDNQFQKFMNEEFDYTRRVRSSHLSLKQWKDFGIKFLENDNALIYALHQSSTNNTLEKTIYTKKEIKEL